MFVVCVYCVACIWVRVVLFCVLYRLSFFCPFSMIYSFPGHYPPAPWRPPPRRFKLCSGALAVSARLDGPRVKPAERGKKGTTEPRRCVDIFRPCSNPRSTDLERSASSEGAPPAPLIIYVLRHLLLQVTPCCFGSL